MYRYLFLICFFTTCALNAVAQLPDTTAKTAVKSKDTLISTRRDTDVSRSFKPRMKKDKAFHPDTTHSPKTAVLRSLLIPGWGQVYNHKWWKVPVIYGGLGLLGWAVVFNNTYYNEFLALSKYREHGVTPTPKDPYYTQYQLYINQPDQALYDATDGYRRNRDLSILGILGAWGINVVDAYIDAKFISAFTIDNNLSMKINPGLLNQPVYALNSYNSYIPAIKITFTIR
ncbi:MAG: hypothetical protein JWP45_532 [Mucilaginibacter sp.]|nr:hypothetical protein [Mucilaginibacter sp.]